MFDITFFDRIYFSGEYSLNSFMFGLTFSSRLQDFIYYNNDEQNEPELATQRETGLDICLGIVSFHMGWRHKEESE